MPLQLHHADWHTCQVLDSRADLYLYGLYHALPSALILIASVIVLAGIAENSSPLGSGRSPSGWCSRSIFTVYTWQGEIIFILFNHVNFRCHWSVTKIFRSMVVGHFQCTRSNCWHGCHTKYSIFHLVFSKWYPTHLFSLTLLRVCGEWLYPWLHPCEEGEPNPWTGLGVGRASCWRWVCVLVAPTIL